MEPVFVGAIVSLLTIPLGVFAGWFANRKKVAMDSVKTTAETESLAVASARAAGLTHLEQESMAVATMEKVVAALSAANDDLLAETADLKKEIKALAVENRNLQKQVTALHVEVESLKKAIGKETS